MLANPIVWLAAGAVGIVVVGLMLRAAGLRSETQLSAVRQEMQNSLAAQLQAVAGQLNHLMQSVNQQLGQVRQELQTGVASSGQLATEAQREVSKQLKSSTDALLQMTEKVGEMQQTSRDLSSATQTLQSVLGGAKTRGSLGEIALESLLADSLPQSRVHHAVSIRFHRCDCRRGGAPWRPPALLSTRNSRLSLTAVSRMKAMTRAVIFARPSASTPTRSPTSTYFRDERTLEYALMFVPSESIYYELLMSTDAKHGRLEEYCRAKRVLPVSPNTFFAILSAVAISLQGQQIEENAKHLLANLAGVMRQIEGFAETYERLGTHLRNAQRNYEEADGRLNRARNSLDQMAQGALPDSEPKAMESATTE